MPAAATRIDKGGFVVKTHEIDRGIRRICQPAAAHLPEIVPDSFAHCRGSHRCGKAYHEAIGPLKRYSSGKRSRGRAVLQVLIDLGPFTPDVPPSHRPSQCSSGTEPWISGPLCKAQGRRLPAVEGSKAAVRPRVGVPHDSSRHSVARQHCGAIEYFARAGGGLSQERAPRWSFGQGLFAKQRDRTGQDVQAIRLVQSNPKIGPR